MSYHKKTMTRLTVAIPSKPYDVWIENGLLEQAGALVRDVLGERRNSLSSPSPR